jgi:hypothetical protein
MRLLWPSSWPRLSIDSRDCSFAPLLRLVPGLVYGTISNVSSRPFMGILDIGRDLLSSYGEVLSLEIDLHPTGFLSDGASFVLDMGQATKLSPRKVSLELPDGGGQTL